MGPSGGTNEEGRRTGERREASRERENKMPGHGAAVSVTEHKHPPPLFYVHEKESQVALRR
jgi:hypothetical protein